jgi:hypothetical protein
MTTKTWHKILFCPRRFGNECTTVSAITRIPHGIGLDGMVIGPIQNPVCSHRSDLPGSEELAMIGPFPFHLFAILRLSIALWEGISLGRETIQRSIFYLRNLPVLEMTIRPIVYFLSEKQRDTVFVFYQISLQRFHMTCKIVSSVRVCVHVW